MFHPFFIFSIVTIAQSSLAFPSAMALFLVLWDRNTRSHEPAVR